MERVEAPTLPSLPPFVLPSPPHIFPHLGLYFHLLLSWFVTRQCHRDGYRRVVWGHKVQTTASVAGIGHKHEDDAMYPGLGPSCGGNTPTPARTLDGLGVRSITK